jgi:hypothetical protein
VLLLGVAGGGVGCGTDAAATDDAATGSTTAGTTTSEPTSTTAAGSTSASASTGGVADSTGPGPGPDSTGGESSSGGGPVEPRDCKTLLQARPGLPDGVYMLQPGGDPAAPPYAAWCDMTTDGGGWTLVGRSAAGPFTVPFGWGFSTGELADETQPYSIGAKDLDLQLGEMLYGLHDGGNAWGAYVWKLAVPDDFLLVYEKAPYETFAAPIAGDCDPKGGPMSMRWVGWTDFDGVFIIGENPDEQVDGLEPDMADANTNDCADGGFLHGQPAMLMVR